MFLRNKMKRSWGKMCDLLFVGICGFVEIVGCLFWLILLTFLGYLTVVAISYIMNL